MIINELRTGDILMFRPTGWLGRIVSFVTRSPQYCHCGIVVVQGDFLKLCWFYEIRERAGFRRNHVSNVIDEWNRPTDVFRCETLTELQKNTISYAASACRSTGGHYGWWHAFVTGVWQFLPSCLWPWECAYGHAPHCAEFVSAAYRFAGCDLCEDLPDWNTTPGAIARSSRLKLMGTLETE